MEGLDGLQGLGMLGEISKGEHLEQITSVFPVRVSLWKAYSSTLIPQQDNLLNAHVIFLLASVSERGNVW